MSTGTHKYELDSTHLGDTTDQLHIGEATGLQVFVDGRDNVAVGSLVTTVQFSPDGKYWHDSAATVTGVGMTGRIDVRCNAIMRVRVKTVGTGIAIVHIHTDTFE